MRGTPDLPAGGEAAGGGRAGAARNGGPSPVRVAAVMGLAEFGFATVIPLLPLYLKEHLGASVTLVGVVVAAFAAVDTGLKTVWGGLADRIGRRPVILGGLLLASAAPVLMTLIRSPTLFVPLRLVDGGGSAALWPCAAAAVAERSTPRQRAAGMGTLNMFFLGGLALGPSIGLFVAGAFGTYRAGFYLASALLLAAAGAASTAFRPGESEAAAPSAGPGHLPARKPGDAPDADSSEPRAVAPAASPAALVRVLGASPSLAAMLAVAFVQMFGVGLLTPILVIYAHEVVGLSESMLGVMFLILVLAVAAASVPGGRLADRAGRPRAVAWGMTMAAVGMWVLPLAGRGNFILLGVAAVLLGASYAVSSPAWLALMSEQAPPGRTALVMGASETAQGAGLIVGPVLGGFLYDHLGPGTPFVASALLLTIGTALALMTLRRR